MSLVFGRVSHRDPMCVLCVAFPHPQIHDPRRCGMTPFTILLRDFVATQFWICTVWLLFCLLCFTLSGLGTISVVGSAYFLMNGRSNFPCVYFWSFVFYFQGVPLQRFKWEGIPGWTCFERFCCMINSKIFASTFVWMHSLDMPKLLKLVYSTLLFYSLNSFYFIYHQTFQYPGENMVNFWILLWRYCTPFKDQIFLVIFRFIFWLDSWTSNIWYVFPLWLYISHWGKIMDTKYLESGFTAFFGSSLWFLVYMPGANFYLTFF